MALARQSQPDQSVNTVGKADRPDPDPFQYRPEHPATGYACPAAQASRSCRFKTLPLALRGNGSDVSAIVSGTL